LIMDAHISDDVASMCHQPEDFSNISDSMRKFEYLNTI
jgi:hypothetical protein